MQFFNIRAQVVSLIAPDGRSSTLLDFRQHPTDAMLQELHITSPGGGPTAILTFQKAGGNTAVAWEGVDTRESDALQITQEQADGLGLKPGQRGIDAAGRPIQAPGKLDTGASGGGRGFDNPPRAGQGTPAVDPLDASFVDPNAPDAQVADTGALPGGVVDNTPLLQAKPPRVK